MPTTGGMRRSQTLRQGVMFTETPTLFPLRKISRCVSFRWRSSRSMWKEMDHTALPRSSTTHEMVGTVFCLSFGFSNLLGRTKHVTLYFSDLCSPYRAPNRCLCQACVLHRSSGLVAASSRHWNRPAAVHWGIPGIKPSLMTIKLSQTWYRRYSHVVTYLF